MPHTALDYAKRAAECARLAALTSDTMLQEELLRLRQTYLRLSGKLGLPLHEAVKVPAPGGEGGPRD